MDTQFLLEKTLYERSKAKSATLKDAIYLVKPLLTEYSTRFIAFDDHSITHSMRVLNNANKLIDENIDRLNTEEIFIFLLACYAHDLGMGINDDYYKKHYDEAVDKEYLKKHPNATATQLIRKFHNEFSAILIPELNSYQHQLSEDEESALALLCKSHRNYDLTDRKLFPTDLKVDDTTINMAYLAPLLRLADELDLSDERQRYADDIEMETDPFYIKFLQLKRLIKQVDIEKDKIDIVFNEYPKHMSIFNELKKEVSEEYHYCADIINNETPFKIASQIRLSLVV